ncbi:MAG: thiol reductant ABC exporter subunit CydC [Anaerolineae bacterium]|nr:thiol reductant ABC exporter subunit CydC [Anaerolineae bacterium]
MKTLVRLLTFLRPFWGEVFLSIVLSTATIAAGIGLLGTSAYLIAAAALHPGIAPLQVSVVGVRFFGISRGVLRYAERLVSHSVNFRLLSQLRVWFYRSIEPLAPAQLELERSGDLLTRAIADIEALQDFYVRLVSPPISAVLVSLGVSLFAGGWGLRFGLLLAAGMTITGLVIPVLVYTISARLSRDLTCQRARLGELWVDSLQGMPDWLALGLQPTWQTQLQIEGDRLDENQHRLARVTSLGNAAGAWVQFATAGLMALSAAPLVQMGQLDGVMVAVLCLLALASFEAVLPLSQAAQLLEGALASARRLFELVEGQPAVTDPASPRAMGEFTGLSIRHLNFVYPSNPEKVLTDFNLELAPGRCVVVAGESGAGKSTLTNLLLRFWDCPQQTIWINGSDIREYQSGQVRDVFALVPQRVYLFSGSLESNLRMAAPKSTEAEVEAVYAQVGLSDLILRLPERAASWIGAQGAELSGGERRRVAAARAMLKNSPVLLLDEPTAGLDRESAQELVKRLLDRRKEGQSVIWITHDLSGTEWADEIIVLQAGRVVERGAPATLSVSGGWYAAARKLQSEWIE